jgi:hypothetical protein
MRPTDAKIKTQFESAKAKPKAISKPTVGMVVYENTDCKELRLRVSHLTTRRSLADSRDESAPGPSHHAPSMAQDRSFPVYRSPTMGRTGVEPSTVSWLTLSFGRCSL